MNFSNIEHAIYALMIQLAIGFTTGNWWAGAAAGTFLFLGREHAQHELRNGYVGRNPVIGLQVWRWTRDSQLDLALPALVTLLVANAHQAGVIVPFLPVFILLVALNVADVVLTIRILDAGGRELNPAMKWLMARLGVVPALVTAKVIGLAISTSSASACSWADPTQPFSQP